MKKKLAVGAVGTVLVGWLAFVPDGITHPIRAVRRATRPRGQNNGIYQHLREESLSTDKLTKLAKSGWRSDPLLSRSITQILPN